MSVDMPYISWGKGESNNTRRGGQAIKKKSTHLQHPSFLRRLSEVQEKREPPANELRAAVAGPLRELLGPLVQPALVAQKKDKKRRGAEIGGGGGGRDKISPDNKRDKEQPKDKATSG